MMILVCWMGVVLAAQKQSLKQFRGDEIMVVNLYFKVQFGLSVWYVWNASLVILG